MAEDSDDDDAIAMRPYADDVSASSRLPPRERRTKVFRPKPPSERRTVEKSLLSATSHADSAQDILSSALRRQEVQGVASISTYVTPDRFRGMSLSKFGIAETGRAAGATSLSAGGGTHMPRKAKEWKEGKSMELLDLAFTPVRKGNDGIVRRNYTPISLPYFDFDADQDEGKGDASRKKQRPTMEHVDEGNMNAARELFLTPEGDLQEDKFFLLQFPSVLPELADPSEDVQREEDEASAGAGSSITRFPDGLLGKLKIHKSGKVRMEMGGVPFCLDPGSATFFHQELACVCPLASEMINLGPISSRVVATPDIDAMFKDMELEAASREEAADARAPMPAAAVAKAEPAAKAAAAAAAAAPSTGGYPAGPSPVAAPVARVPLGGAASAASGGQAASAGSGR